MMPLYYIPKSVINERHSLLKPDKETSINNLEKLSMQIENLSQLVEMPGEEYYVKQAACSELQEVLRKYYPDCMLLMYGSSVNGFGIKNRSLDLLFLPFPDYCNFDFPRLGKVSVPSPASILSGETSRDVLSKFDEWAHLKFLKNILRGEKTLVKRIVYIPLKYPTLKVYLSNPDSVICHFSASNRFVVFNSELFQFLVKLDARIKPLVLTLKYWALSLGFMNYKFFSEDAFTLLIIFFLQNINPPILPSVKHLMDLSVVSRVVAGWQTAFTTDENLIQKSKNTEKIDELLIHFFDYYWNFDFSQFIVCPFSGKPLPINDLKNSSDSRLSSFEIASINIQDPFIHSRNLSKVEGQRRSVFKLAAHTAHQFIKTKDKFNFCTLFDSTAYQKILEFKYWKHMTGVSKVAFIVFDYDLVKGLSKTTKNRQLWYEKVCHTVFDVLQYGLLLECEIIDKISWDKKMDTLHTNNGFGGKNSEKEIQVNHKFHLDSSSFDLDLLMSIQCNLYSRTWVGRKSITETSLGETEIEDFNESALKNEFEISMEIVKKNPERRTPIFCFKCDCYKHASPEIPDVLVMIKPLVQAKEFHQVATFLASFIPKTVKKILASD